MINEIQKVQRIVRSSPLSLPPNFSWVVRARTRIPTLSRVSSSVALLSSHRTDLYSPLRLRLHVNLLRRLLKILKQRRTQPSLHPELRREIPVASKLLPFPIQFYLETRKWRLGKKQPKPLLRIRNIRYQHINHRIRARHERLFVQTHARIIKNPHP